MKSLNSILDLLEIVDDAASGFGRTISRFTHISIVNVSVAFTQVHLEAAKAANKIIQFEQAVDSVDSKKIDHLDRALQNSGKAGANAAKSLESMEKAVTKMKELGGILSTAGQIITAGLSAAATSAYDMEQAVDILQAKVSATDAEMKAMSKSVYGLYTSGLVEFPREATESFGRFRQLLEGTDQEIEKVAGGALALEKISYGKLDQDNVTKALEMMQEQWGTDPVKGLDLITAAYNRVGDKAGDMLDTIAKYSPFFKEAGMSAEKMMGMFVAGTEAGASNFSSLGEEFKQGFGKNLNKALDEGALKALKPIFGEEKLFSMLDQIKSGGKEAESAIAAITKGIMSLEDQAAQDNVMSAIFKGSYADLGRDATLAMLNAGPLEDFAGKTAEITDKVKDEWRAMANEMKLAFQPIGATVLDIVKPIVGVITELANGIGAFTKEHPFITKVAVSFLMLVAALALLAGPLMFLATIWIPLTQGFTAMTGVMSGFGLASLTALWPILLVIAAVIALIAAGWWLYDNWEMVSTYLVAAWELIKSVGLAIWEGLSAYFTMLIEFWKGIFTGFIQFLTGDWSGAWETIKTTFFNAFTTIDGWFGGWISGLFESGQKIITTIVSGILSVKNKIAEALQSAFQWADQFLPHSDAELGPFSRLTESGMAIPETMAIGIHAADDSLVNAMESSFSQVPSYTPSLANSEISQGKGSQSGPSPTYVDFRPTIQVSLQAKNMNDKEDLYQLAEQMAETIAERLHHVLSGTGTVALE
ncbi:phage tail protein [Brevibacillus borstelensis]|nr:phage tail protein [Brevibacillus borstelensis]